MVTGPSHSRPTERGRLASAPPARSRIRALAAGCVLALVSLFATTSASVAAGQTVTFPSTPYEGLQFTFTVSGAQLGTPEELKEIPGVTEGAGRIYRDGALTGGPVTVTGYATGTAGAYGYLQVSLAGSKEDSLAFNAPATEWRKDFSFTVADPERYYDLTLNISIQRFSRFDSITVSANFVNPNPPSQAPTLEPSPSPTPSGKPPCPEAVSAFSLDPNASIGMQYDYADIRQQFDQAIIKYEKEATRTAFAQDNILGTLPAVAWLGNQGGATSLINRQFVFTSDADREKWKSKLPSPTEVPFGTERALYEAMFAYQRDEHRRLTPGDVLFLALEQRQGDAKEAMLLAHNTLRSLARMEQSLGNTDFEWTMVEHNPGFITQYLSPLVDPAPLGEGQNTGSWYHLFGTAYFEMQARGTWGAYTLVQLTGDALDDRITELAQQIARVMKNDPNLQLRANQTIVSKAANEIEQVARKHIFGSPDDPAKYCFNVTGAKIGAWLYQQRLLIKPAIQPPPSPPPGVTIPTIFGPLPLGSRPGDWRFDQHDPDTVISSSPLNITWSDGQDTMVLDQGSSSLYGYFPVHVFPQYEADGQTWGMIWTNTGTDAYRLTLQASQSGWAHLTRVHGNQAFVYPIELAEGETLTLQVDPDSPTAPLTRADGTQVLPIELAPEPVPEPDRDNGDLTLVVLGGLVVALLGGGLVALGLALARRRRATPSAPAWVPTPPPSVQSGPVGGPSSPSAGTSGWRPPVPQAACPRCHLANPVGVATCRHCGLPLTAPAATSAPCPACGHRLGPDAAFCGGCGAKVR